MNSWINYLYFLKIIFHKCKLNADCKMLIMSCSNRKEQKMNETHFLLNCNKQFEQKLEVGRPKTEVKNKRNNSTNIKPFQTKNK